MKRVARALLVAALFGAVAVAGQDSSTGTNVTPTPDASQSSTGVVPQPTPTPAQSSTGVTPTPTPAQSSTGVTPTPTPAVSSSSSPSPSPSSVSSTAGGQPTPVVGSSTGSESFSTAGAGPLTVGLCDLLTTANGLNNRDEKNEETALGGVITAAILGTTDTKNGIKVTGVVNQPSLQKYFDGSLNYRQNGTVRSPYAMTASPDYTHDTNQLNILKGKLVAFFGQAPVLGCSAPGFPTYSLVGDDGKTTYHQYDVHYNMGISGAEFTLFNQQIIDAAQYYGADANARAIISNKLALFGRTNVANANSNEICHTDSCPCASDVTGNNCDNGVSAASSLQASFFSLAVVAAGALFAMAL